jgi:hypothetical protein
VKRERKLIAEKVHSFFGYAGMVTHAVKPAPMTLGNMRANGVRTLAAWCLGRVCVRHRVLDVSGYPDEKLP